MEIFPLTEKEIISFVPSLQSLPSLPFLPFLPFLMFPCDPRHAEAAMEEEEEGEEGDGEEEEEEGEGEAEEDGDEGGVPLLPIERKSRQLDAAKRREAADAAAEMAMLTNIRDENDIFQLPTQEVG